jgi:2-polyprenyl-3-methyl-5-hydroxy-6-metoxy-1,4-benzoquinol methylase
MPTQRRLAEFISASAYTDPVDIKKLRFIYGALEKYVRSSGKSFEDLHVLEVACGTGEITLSLASLCCQVTAFDIDQKAVEYLQARIEDRKISNLTVTVDDGCTFDDGRVYDIVVASEVFEHVLEPARLAGSITRRMGRGSYLVVTTPNGYGPWELKNRIDVRSHMRKWNALRRLLGKTPYVRGAGADHCQFYMRRDLVSLFASFSLTLIDFAKSDSFLAIFRPLRRNHLLQSADTRLADTMPYWLASGWYFVFELTGLKGANSGA